jgi:cytidine deaminase
MEKEIFKDLLRSAKEVACESYSRRTHRSSGAALLARNGNIYTGCELEISNFTSSICAGKSALAKAISDGVREFVAVAVCGNGADQHYLCGDCRQAYAEFSDDLIVISEKDPDRHIRLSDLLPD